MRYYYTYYPKVREIEIPDRNAIGIFSPLETPHMDREKILHDAFEQPVNSPKLSELATPDDRVLIVLDDALEPTPTVFPFFYIVQALHAAGVSDAHISVLIANASHRANTSEEVDRKIGAEMRKKYKVFQSALNDHSDSYHIFGTAHTDAGAISVRADARLRDASLIVGISGTYPNRFKGFTGGGSLIFPGLGDQDMIGAIYLAGAEQPAEEILGHTKSPAREMIWKLLEFIPAFKFCVDVLIDRTQQIASCVTGSPASVYRVGADIASRMSKFSVPERADIVVIDSHPFDANLFQASHALYAAMGVVKEGGEIIIVSPLLEALSVHSAGLAKNISESRKDLLHSAESGALSHNPVAGAQLAALREVVDRTSRITFVSMGPGSADPERFGFYHSNHAQDVLDAAIERKGSDARVALITHGGLAVPRAD
ncbi:MAG TPA: lactate racemase domain-containing protein [Candidatus Kapabacteria bacterium]|jgi:nickel-dependent lactate racemase|nr:lactate racemase domain-containing protein [Candidatus Kapabacteria bacterium]